MKRNKIRTIVCAAATLTLLFAGAIQASAEDVEFQGSQIPENGWYEENGKFYWYENGVRQGTEGRGKEIYDPASDAWYWLDAVQGGAKAVNKDVYQESASAYPDRPDGTGKWCRYDENGHMVKGWQTTANGATYYFEQQTGAMAKGFVVIDGKKCGFDVTTGVGINGWSSLDGKDYWYEKAVRQGTEGRGKEIYDPASDAWYWLDAVQDGAKAVNKDVYQESASAYPDRPDGTGKWCRYDGNGHMVKGWQVTADGASYYFEAQTGAMAKGSVTIDGIQCYFDPVTGQQQVQMDASSRRVLELVNEERRKAGLSALAVHQGLQNAADKRAVELVSLFSHTRPNGTSCFTVLDEYNVSYRRAGENIAEGYPTPEMVVNGWMNSSGHRANILNPEFTHLAVGHYGSEWVQLFIKARTV